MLMNLLPGLRELRAPLVSGYLWLISAWLFLGRMGWLPSERPRGNGEVARLWDLGGTLGKTVVLAVITFIAYLIGSFVEINPDGRIAQRFLTPLALADRQPWYMGLGFSEFDAASKLVRELGLQYLNLRRSARRGPEQFRTYPVTGVKVSRAISGEAMKDLSDLFERRNVIPDRDHFREVARDRLDSLLMARDEAAMAVEAIEDDVVRRMAQESIAASVIDEMQQLASRLLVRNQDLYGKYDRQMAEASVRINISVPLTLMLVLAVWLSSLPLWSQVLLTLLSLAFGFMLLRQGFLRAMSARDVIVQALAIGEVESRYVPSEEASKKLVRDQIEDRPSAQ
jgi:hypothetical protein